MIISKLKLALTGIVVVFIFSSCENISELEVTEPISAEETIALLEVDDIGDEVNNIIDDYLYVDINTGAKGVAEKSHTNLDCLIKTVVWNGNSKTVTLDFGEFCELPNGHVLSGKVIISYVFDSEAKTITVTQLFDGFTFNGNTVEGGSTIIRFKEGENGNPQSIRTFDVTVTWPDGEFIHRAGTKKRDWIEGFGTGTWGDNVFLISGSWTSTFKNGTVFTKLISEEKPLRREMACRFIVSGIMEITKGNQSGMLDFGDGSCDNKAWFTKSNDPDNPVEIILKKRKH